MSWILGNLLGGVVACIIAMSKSLPMNDLYDVYFLRPPSLKAVIQLSPYCDPLGSATHSYVFDLFSLRFCFFFLFRSLCSRISSR